MPINKSKFGISTPAEQAHALGLHYGGFGQWIQPGPDRKVVAKTMDGRLVRVDNDERKRDQDLGELNIFRFDIRMIQLAMKDKESRFLQKFNKILKHIIKSTESVNVVVPRGTEPKVASYLRQNGISKGLKLVPIDSKDISIIRQYIADKIKEGYSVINYFDMNEDSLEAAKSLKATYNKLETSGKLELNVHPLTKYMEPQKPQVSQP